jgi:rod shape-determining protein MreD
MKKSVLITFFLSAILTLFLTPILNINFFSSFLAMLFLNSSFITSLWLSALSGLFLDFFSSNIFGLYALSYTLTAFFLYRRRKFFKNKKINIAVFTFFISITLTAIKVVLLFIFENGIKISYLFFITDFLIMPLLDSFYAFLFFYLPFQLLEFMKKNILKQKND